MTSPRTPTIWLAAVAALALTLPQAAHAEVTLTRLRCEFQRDPLAVDTPSPRLSWALRPSDPGARGTAQSAYQIRVAASPAPCAKGAALLWDSGKVASAQSSLVTYGGGSLASRQQVWWSVRIWDERGEPSPWSEVATWTMGVLPSSRWHAEWIGSRASDAPRDGQRLGYAIEASAEDEPEWIRIDLGESRQIDRVVLHPKRHDDPKMGGWVDGYGFPLRFRIEVSDDPGFAISRIAIDRTAEDVPNPGFAPVSLECARAQGRYVRLVATRLWPRPWGQPYCLCLGEIEVYAGGANVALGRPATARDSAEFSGWGVAYITDGLRLAGRAEDEADSLDAAVLLRTDLRLDARPRRAIARMSGLGYGELYINGAKVGDAVLDPAFTDYTKRVLYRTYDVTALLRAGDNALGAVLGNGFYRLATPDLFGYESAPWTAPPKLLLELELTDDRGVTRFVGSDARWRWSTGPITYNCLRGGESYDFRLEEPGWCAPGFDDAGWEPAITVPAPGGRLVPQALQPERVTQTIRPVSVTEPAPGVYVFDLGAHIAGYVRFATSGPAGTKVTLDLDEEVNQDGTITAKSHNSHTWGRYQVGEMTLSGRERDVFEPRFAYHGFRYVQVRGLARAPRLEDLVGLRVHNDLADAGGLTCSNPTVNRIHAACRYAMLNCLHGVVTEPAREKINWTEDAHNTVEVGIRNTEFAPLLRKWLDDVIDSQEPNGHVPPINPTGTWGRAGADGSPGSMSDPWWGGVLVEMPWQAYLFYGDLRTLEESYEPMRRFVDYLGTTASDGVFLDWCLGDWLEVGCGGIPTRTPIVQTSTAAYCYYARLVSEAARVLGLTDDARRYAELSEHIRDRFNERFLDPATGLYAADSQTSQALPLELGIAPEDRRDLVLERLVENVHERDDHLSTGFVGYHYLLDALAHNGHTGLAYTIATQPDYPGWAHMLRGGGTTLWESWAGIAYNFSSLGAVDAWFYSALAGIRPDPSRPGFQRFVVRPGVVGDLTWLMAHYDSEYGRIAVRWRSGEGRLRLVVVVPPNTGATVYVPTANPSETTEGGRRLSEVAGVEVLPSEPGFAVCRVPSGSYEFEAPAP